MLLVNMILKDKLVYKLCVYGVKDDLGIFSRPETFNNSNDDY